jgi:phage/conjugal plasmid C-4 type zinc finger TraR family protein
MTDEADQAQRVADLYLQIALRRLNAGLRPRDAEPEPETCLACGAEIPEARRRALPGVCTCIGCQVAIERGRGGD